MLPALVAVVAPLVLWPVEFFWPYPYLIEELAKAGIVFWLLPRRAYLTAALCGLLFTFSESVLYLFNIISFGNFEVLAQRLLLTSLLHTGTFLVLAFFTTKNRRLILAGLTLTVIIHYLFNLALATTRS